MSVSIGINVSTKFESSISVTPASGAVSVHLVTNLEPLSGTNEPIPYQRVWVMIHGEDEDLRSLAKGILAAIEPPATAPTLEESRQ